MISDFQPTRSAMFIPRSIILLLLIILIFSPAIESWVSVNQAAWYRPFIAWAFIILIVYRSQKVAANNKQKKAD